MASAGRVCRILDRDVQAKMVRCRVPQVGDIWFAITALTHVRPNAVKRKVPADTHSEGSEDCDEYEDADGENYNEVKKRVDDMEKELRSARQTVAEALMAVSEL